MMVTEMILITIKMIIKSTNNGRLLFDLVNLIISCMKYMMMGFPSWGVHTCPFPWLSTLCRKIDD